MKRVADEGLPTNLKKTQEGATGVSKRSLRKAMKEIKTTHLVHQLHL
jgi:hypothetical protein